MRSRHWPAYNNNINNNNNILPWHRNRHPIEYHVKCDSQYKLWIVLENFQATNFNQNLIALWLSSLHLVRKQFFQRNLGFFPFQGRLSLGKNIIITFSCGILSSLFSGSMQTQRYVLAIRNLRFLFLASTMDFVRANDQCRTEVNIQGVALKRSVFKSWSVAAPHLCDVKCGKEITCQSYNYNRKYQICELNIILLLIRLSEFCKLFSDFVRW